MSTEITPWSAERAWNWYTTVAGVIRGCNYLPRTACNDTEMWQADTFDPAAIDQELTWAQQAGYSSLRVFLQYLVWHQDPPAFIQRFDQFLAIAHRHGITTMPVLFDDCSFANRDPYLGPQDPPVPGVHNSRWVPSPGLQRVTDRAAWPDLQRYVQDVVCTFAHDGRILVWDLYNEPGASGMGAKSLPLLEASFAWARQVRPSQPLTVAPWEDYRSPLSQRMLQLSDVVSFHGYDAPEAMAERIALCAQLGRPLLCTEWLRRQSGNTFQNMLPIFAQHKVGWYHWGFVAGRTQTYMPWGSKPKDPMPSLWQHDVLHPDGGPYDAAELDLVRNYRF